MGCTRKRTAAEAHPYEVFLGGSCNPTTWRSDVAIPTLQKMGITFFNPQVDDWSQELIEIEHRAKQSARVLFFVLDAETRAAAAAVEAAHLAAASRPLVLVLQPYRRGQRISGEPVSDQEYLDLSRGQAILQEVAERQELPVFTELAAALRCTQQLLRGHAPLRPPASMAIATHLMKLRRTFDAADVTKCGSLTLEQTSCAILAFTSIELSVHQIKSLILVLNTPHSDLETPTIKRNSSSLNGISTHATNGDKQENEVDFEMFCSILAEIIGDIRGADDAIMSSPNIDEVERELKRLLKLEARNLLDSVETQSSENRLTAIDSVLPETDVSEKHNDQDNSNLQDIHSNLTNVSECSSDPTRWRAHTAKWRQMLNCVQAAILGFVSKIELNAAFRSSPHITADTAPSLTNGHQSPVPSNGSVSPGVQSLKSGTTNTTYSRRREMEGSSKHKHRASTDAEQSDDSSQSSKDSSAPVTPNGKPVKKLSVFIPKVMVGSGSEPGSAVLTPQSSRRLDGLADAVRDEPAAMRDVYLGGSCVVRTNWRMEQVVPVLEQHNLTYYIPSMNDYSRMFSAPPYTPASSAKFTFEGLWPRSGDKLSKLDKTTHYDKVLRSNSNSEVTGKHNNTKKNLFDIENNENIDNVFTTNSKLANDDSFVEEVGNPRFSSVSLISESSEGRGPQKHERSPAPEGNLPGKRPKYSQEGPGAVSDDKTENDGEEVEIRTKSCCEGPYPLHSGGDNRLSASDFYRIPENASPAPFSGMYDDLQVRGSRVLLFGVTRDTRCMAPMVLASHCIGLRPRAVVLCVQLLDQPQGLSERAVKDYNRGRLYLVDLAKREGVPVFNNLEEAAECVVRKLQTKDY